MKLVTLSLLILSCASSFAEVNQNTSESKSALTTTTKNSRTHNFEDLLVNGKYHFADEAVSTIEADKVFDSLIGVRTDFKDRLEESSTNK